MDRRDPCRGMHGAAMKCGCYFDPEEDVIQFCPLHAAAEAMNDALNEIARDATELAAMEGIERSERRAWQAIANKARNR